MSLDPVLHAPLSVKIHLATVLPAFVIGTWQIFLSRKGAPVHRALGYVYLGLMTITAIDALFIHELMPRAPLGLSPIHLFVALTLFGVVNAVLGARKHDIRRHRNAMIGVYVGGILIAGSLTLLPGRILHAVVFGTQ
jgi:uncharacterized membrane protein